MEYNVQFPELGLHFKLNPTAFTIGSLSVQWYGILIGLGFMLAIWYGFRSCKKMNINKDGLFNAIIVGLIAGIVGARLYYVVFFAGDKYLQNPMLIFNIREGGLGIYGGIIGGLVGGAIAAKLSKINVFAVLDVASVGFLIGQGIGRWGNFMNQEAFGYATDLPWGMISERTQLEVVGAVHPCFLYESLLCLIGVAVLHLFTRYFRRYDGQTFLLYVIWYGASRFFIEGLRTDSLLVPGLDLRVSQAVAALSVLAAIVLLIIFARRTTLTGCGSKAVMELNGIVLGQDGSKGKDDVVPEESTIFKGKKYMSGTEEETEKEEIPFDEAEASDARGMNHSDEKEDTEHGEAD